MKSPTAPKMCRCYQCKDAFISWKGAKSHCEKCWQAITERWAAEDASLFYTSPLAGYNG